MYVDYDTDDDTEMITTMRRMTHTTKDDDDDFADEVEFNYDGKIEILSNGEIIEFNNKKIHGVRKVTSERWSLSIRKVL